MNFLGIIRHESTEVGLDYEYNKKLQKITPSYRKNSFEQITQSVSKIQNEEGKKVLFIGISGGQASGKKKISEFFHNHIDKSETICEMSFFKPKEENRQLTDDDKSLIKDCNSYDKKRRLYLIDINNPLSYDYNELYNTLKNISEGKQVKIPFFDEKEMKYVPEKDKIIDPSKNRLIILDGYFIFRDQKIRELLDLKIYKDVEDDIRLGRLVLREKKYLVNHEAYELFFGIYQKFIKITFDENIVTYKKYANIILPDYDVNEEDNLEGDETLQFLISSWNNLSKKKKIL